MKTMLMQILGWQTKSIMVCYGIFFGVNYKKIQKNVGRNGEDA